MKYISKSLLSCVLGMLVPLLPVEAIAEEFNTSAKTTQSKVTFNPPLEDLPRNSVGGGTRTSSQCFDETQSASFSALLPKSARGLTAESHPAILAYIPETSAQNVFFSWRGENDRDHYQAILPIENEGAIVSLNLPETAPALEVGKNYQWALGIMCNGRLQPDSPMIHGQVERIKLAPSIQSSLDSDISLKNAALYGENSLWYETVATLAQLKTAQPSDRDLASNWSELLDSVGLTEFSDVPLKIGQPNDR